MTDIYLVERSKAYASLEGSTRPSSDLKFLKSLNLTDPPTLSMTLALRDDAQIVSQVQAGVTKASRVHICNRFQDHSSSCRRTLNTRVFPMLQVMRKSARAARISRVLSSHSAHIRTHVDEIPKHGCAAHFLDNIPGETARSTTLFEKFPSLELTMNNDNCKPMIDTDTKTIGNNDKRAPFSPSNPHEARASISSFGVFSRTEWVDKSSCPGTPDTERFRKKPSPRRRYSAGILHKFAPHLPTAEQTLSGAAPFRPCNPAQARSQINCRMFLSPSAPRNTWPEARRDARKRELARIARNQKRLSVTLTRQFHGHKRAETMKKHLELESE